MKKENSKKRLKKIKKRNRKLNKLFLITHCKSNGVIREKKEEVYRNGIQYIYEDRKRIVCYKITYTGWEYYIDTYKLDKGNWKQTKKQKIQINENILFYLE